MTAGRTVNSLSQDWGTPKKYVEAVREVLGGEIALDPCANHYSIVNARTEYCLPEHDGLKESWKFASIYVNPPYGAGRERGTKIKHWLCRCAQAHREYGAEVLALVPVATNTSHWKKYVWGVATGVCFLYDTRLRFLVRGSRDEGKGAPMACAMVYWGRRFEQFMEVFLQFGAVVDLRPLQKKRIAHSARFIQRALVQDFYRP